MAYGKRRIRSRAATYAIHSGNQALVFDTFTSTAQAQWVHRYLERRGIERFTVVQR